MPNYLKKNMLALSLAVFSFFVVPVVSQYVGISLINEAQAKEGHESDSGGASHKGKGPKYKGGRGSEGHGGSDSSHKGSSSHGGGSKTLEDTVFKSEGGHSTGDAGHKGGSSGKGGKKYMGGGKGGHDETEGSSDGGSDGGESPGHTEPK